MGAGRSFLQIKWPKDKAYHSPVSPVLHMAKWSTQIILLYNLWVAVIKYFELDLNDVAVCGRIRICLETNFFLFQGLDTGIGATRFSFNSYWVAKRPGREADHSPSTGERLRISGAVRPVPPTFLHGMHGRNFTCTSFSFVKLLTLESDSCEDLGAPWYVLFHLMNELRPKGVSVEPLCPKDLTRNAEKKAEVTRCER
jgi:hypothetical protein